jgi:hypothetical protein
MMVDDAERLRRPSLQTTPQENDDDGMLPPSPARSSARFYWMCDESKEQGLKIGHGWQRRIAALPKRPTRTKSEEPCACFAGVARPHLDADGTLWGDADPVELEPNLFCSTPCMWPLASRRGDIELSSWGSRQRCRRPGRKFPVALSDGLCARKPTAMCVAASASIGCA